MSNRVIAPEQWEWLNQVPFWFCTEFPLERIPPRRRGKSPGMQQPWFLNMLQHVQEHGLRHPVLLNNSDKSSHYHTFRNFERYSVRAGNHRVACARLLGWDFVPAIVWGLEPRLYVTSGPWNLEEANDYIHDGRIIMEWHGPNLVDATDPKVEFAA